MQSMEFSKAKTLRIIFSLASPFLLLNCIDYSVKLPNKYKFSRCNFDTHLISDPERTVIVGPDIDGIFVHGNIVMGHVKRPDFDIEPGICGYFVIFTKSNVIEQGLSKKDWLERLKRECIEDEPQLTYPLYR